MELINLFTMCTRISNFFEFFFLVLTKIKKKQHWWIKKKKLPILFKN